MATENPEKETGDTFYNNTAQPELEKPTEEADVTEQVLAPETEDEPEPKEPKDSEGLDAKDEEEESQYIELDGEEIDLEDVKKWRDGHLMQSDYTKKTTALKDERTKFEAERDSQRENLQQEIAKVSEMRDILEVLAQEDEAINWAELKEDDPDRYIELKEQADKRKAALEKVKAERSQPVDDPAMIQAEQVKLYKANPEWFDKEGNPTDAYQSDVKLMNDYSLKAGFQPEEFAQMTRAHYLQTILKAAKYDALQDKARVTKAKREQVPVTTKPKAKVHTPSKSAADVFYGKTGT